MAGYTVAGLKHGIERCHVNINVLKQAIQKERNTIKEYNNMIRDLNTLAERVAARDEFAAANPGPVDARKLS